MSKQWTCDIPSLLLPPTVLFANTHQFRGLVSVKLCVTLLYVMAV